MSDSLRCISLSYSNAESRASALRLILTLRRDWRDKQDTIEFVRFTDGITNTLLKAVNKLPGLTQHEIDEDAILLRAYGKGSDVLIDREREARAHSLLASHNLAPPLLARFDNGLLYKYIEGTVTKPEDLRRPDVWRAVARRLGEWHASLPISSISLEHGAADVFPDGGHNVDVSGIKADAAPVQPNPESLTPGKPTPNIWTVIQKWIFALPSNTEKEKAQKAQLQEELNWLVQKLGDTTGPNSTPLVFSHCDLLSGNIIIETLRATELERHPIETTTNMYHPAPLAVNFIDYEYATPAPAAFDIANHFAEWGGLDCDFNALPTRKERRDFLDHYLRSYNKHLDRPFSEEELDELFDQVDAFRGVPGFYWGVWSLIQTLISQIDFDYASYAQVRLGEYWAWKAEEDGSREKSGAEKHLRERRWAQDD